MPLSENLLLVNSMDINYEDEFYSALDLDPNTRHDDLQPSINARIALTNMDRDLVRGIDRQEPDRRG